MGTPGTSRPKGSRRRTGAAYRFAGYDPPFTLPMRRRNEVMIPVKRLKAMQPSPGAWPHRLILAPRR